MALGDGIEALDYNTIRGKIIEVMGTGSASFGYGQTLQSSPVFSDDIIRKSQWDNLRNDIINARLHQIGEQSAVVDIADGQIIDDRAADPAVNFDVQTNLAREQRFLVTPDRTVLGAIGIGNDSVEPVPGEYVFSSTWNSSLELEFSSTFSNADEARYFFNSGGKIQISASFSNYTSTLQNQSWNSLLSAIGTVEFGAATDTDVTYYGLTDEYQTYFRSSPSFSAIYDTNNYIKIEAKTNVADNTLGTATSLTVKISLVDDYVDPGNSPGDNPDTVDQVNGTVKIILSELKASGTLQPTGSFSINSPLHSVGSFSAS